MQNYNELFARLTSADIQKYEGMAIKEALDILQNETISNLTARVTGSTRSGVTPMGAKTKPMTKGVKKNVDVAYAMGSVHILGDYRLKWFELGTDERITTGARSKSRKGDIKKTIPAGLSRGRIDAKHFFKDARENDNMLQSYEQSLLKNIEQAFEQ